LAHSARGAWQAVQEQEQHPHLPHAESPALRHDDTVNVLHTGSTGSTGAGFSFEGSRWRTSLSLLSDSRDCVSGDMALIIGRSLMPR
jgi:hypothetical protein